MASSSSSKTTTIINFHEITARPVTGFEHVSHLERFQDMQLGDIEAASKGAHLVNILPLSQNEFMRTLNYCYADHVPFVLTPQIAWALIQNGLNLHFNQHHEELQGRIVNFQQQEEKQVTIERADFRMGRDNDWESCISQFKEAVSSSLGENAEILAPKFSETSKTEATVFTILALGIVKKYFAYSVFTKCGIPTLYIRGSAQDWIRIGEHVARFADWDYKDINLTWWITPLEYVLSKIIDAVSGNGGIDEMFFSEIYKIRSGSGGDQVSGWANVFFPYLDHDEETGKCERNPYLLSFNKGKGPSVNSKRYPSGVSVVPFTWSYSGKPYQMSWVAGIIGASAYSIKGALEPQLGWAVIHNS